MHVLALDGVYARHKEIPRFYKSDSITDSEVAALIERIARSVCENCGAAMRAPLAVIDPFSVALYLRPVGLEPGPKARELPRTGQPYLQFDPNDQA